MNLIDDLVTKISAQLIQNRRYIYSEEPLDQFLKQNPYKICEQDFIKNKRGESLNLMLIKNNKKFEQQINSNKQNNFNYPNLGTSTDTCIIYAHGLGSNKLEGLHLANNISHTCNFDICTFDFSGSGKSEGDYTTYGRRQQDDINAILIWLDSKRIYKKYILWGRSMGATAIILSQGRNPHSKIQCMILDSPFFSFQKAAIEIASRNSVLPEIMLGYMLEPLKAYMQKHQKQNNPFLINLEKQISNIQKRILLIYCKSDNIVSYLHSKQIGRLSSKSPVQLQIQENHNKPRKKQTYLKVIDFILKNIQINTMKKKRSSSKRKGRGISVSSKDDSSQKQTPRHYKVAKSKGKYSEQTEIALKLKSQHIYNSVGLINSSGVMRDSDKGSNTSIRWNSKTNMIKSVFYDYNDTFTNTFRIDERDLMIQQNRKVEGKCFNFN